MRWVALCTVLWCMGLQAQQPLERVEPPHWYVGMPDSTVQLLLYGDDMAACSVAVQYPGVTVVELQRVPNPRYLFVTMQIEPNTAAGTLELVLTRDGHSDTIPYPLFERSSRPNRHSGLGQQDVLYLIYPDRFANGDSSNDYIPGMLDTTLNRSVLTDRHGGDLQGIIDRLDYLQQLGITALWLNPVFTNDQPRTSYHGYNATNLYDVDPRLGSNVLYHQLADSLHRRGMKLVMDLVLNHVGNETWWVKDPPSPTWFHEWPTFTKSSFRATTLSDPYASQYDRRQFLEGWFDASMVDLNQDDSLLARYLIQQTLWWTEYAGLDGFRLDTYAFSDPDFLVAWGDAVAKAYPRVSLFGETFVDGPAEQNYFHGRAAIDKAFQPHLTGLTDFSLYFALLAGLTDDYGWDSGISEVYKVLAADYQLRDASGNVIFLDNHDLPRFFTAVGEDLGSYKMGLVLLLTLRGIPCLYYGTEILMANPATPDGLVRLDFPGGWAADSVDKFVPAGRTAAEQEAFTYLQRLLSWRREHVNLLTGKLMQFVPEDGCYVYFRYTDDECAMVVVNTATAPKTLDMQRYAERLSGMTSATEVATGIRLGAMDKLEIGARTAQIWQVRR